MRLRRSAFLILLYTWFAQAATAAVSVPGFLETTNALPGVNLVTDLEFAPDDSHRLFLALKTGTIRIVKNGQLLPVPFLTLDPPPYTGAECGLLAVCFDPNFAVNGFVYIFVTVSSSEQQIQRYTALGDIATDQVLIRVGLPTQGSIHNGGALAIGHDGRIYWGIGDNATGSNTLTSLASKIGRANLDGTAPELNPYAYVPTRDPYIWAEGFRNPFKCAFQPSTGLLWVNVAGADYEQSFLVQRGQNAGWPQYEGNQPPPFIQPKIKYAQPQQKAITGACFYNSTLFPPEYHGNYFFCEYINDRIYRAKLDQSNNVASLEIFGTNVARPIDIVTGPDGALYYMGHRTNRLYRLAYTNQTQSVVVSPVYVNMAEGGIGVVHVSLRVQPANNVLVTVTSSAGSPRIRALDGELLFTPENYSTPQPAHVQVSDDNDTFGSRGTLTFSSSALPDREVFINAYDPDSGQLRFRSVFHSTNKTGLELAAEQGVGIYLESSTDLRNWQRLSTNYATNDSIFILAPAPTIPTNQFYRARTLP